MQVTIGSLAQRRILPSASIATMVAFLPTFAGAALMALFIRSASLGAGFFSCAFAMRHRANAAQAQRLPHFFFINFLPRKEPISVIRAQSGSLRSCVTPRRAPLSMVISDWPIPSQTLDRPAIELGAKVSFKASKKT